MDRDKLLKLIKTKAYQEGKFRVSSGQILSWYLDFSQILLDGKNFDLVRIVLRQYLQSQKLQFTAVGGLTMGADPLSFLIADSTRAKAFSIRKAAKAHGVEAGRIAGPINRQDKILVVDDVTTTGASLLEPIKVLLEEGMKIVGAMVVVDRSQGKAATKLQSVMIPLHSVFKGEEITQNKS